MNDLDRKSEQLNQALQQAWQECAAAEAVISALPGGAAQASVHLSRAWARLQAAEAVITGGIKADGEELIEASSQFGVIDSSREGKALAEFLTHNRKAEETDRPCEDPPSLQTIESALEGLKRLLKKYQLKQKRDHKMRWLPPPWRKTLAVSLGVLALSVYGAGSLYFLSLSPREWFVRRYSRLKILEAKQEWGRVQFDRSCDHNPLAVARSFYPHGLGVHARSTIKVELPKGSKILRGKYGVDDEACPAADVVFRISSKGRVLFESGVVRPGNAAQPFLVPLNGLRTLDLVVEPGPSGSNSCDHADWLDLRAE